MKKITLLTSVFLLFTFIVNAQEDTSDSPYTEYNKWSIDIAAGLSHVSTPFSSPLYEAGDFANTMVYNLGARYMLNEKFGVRGGVMFAKIDDADNSLPFSTDMLTFTAEGVFNLGSILNFSDFSNRFNVFAHGGAQISGFKHDESFNLEDKDNTYGFMAGITPQIKLSENIAFNLDLTVLGNLKHQRGIDGNLGGTTRNFDGMIVNATAGLSIYLGEHDKHADWMGNSTKQLIEDRVGEFEDKLAAIEKDMQDTDKDGVADYLDREPNTTSGVAVNAKGESIDRNNNGIPDELEKSLKETYVTKEYASNTYYAAGLEGVKPDANDDLVNVYFKFDSTQPEYYSLDAISQIVKYMRVYPEAEAVLTGYADQIGNTKYNNKLSEDRAKRVYDIVVAAGIDKSRLSYKGGGIDNSVSKDSDAARQMVRRVSFKLK